MVLPGSTQRLRFEVRDVNDTLTAPSDIAVAVKDPSRSTRVVYDAANLTLISTGVYVYAFDIPGDVIVGDWHANVRVTLPDGNGVENYSFQVMEY